MARKSRLKRVTAFDAANVLLLAILCFIMLYPMLYIIGRSFMGATEKALNHWRVIPHNIRLDAYEYIVKRSSFVVDGLRNSILRTLGGTALDMLITLPMAYVLSKRNYPFRNQITGAVVFTMWFGGGLIPHYLLVKSLGLIDTFWALWLPGLVSSWNLLVMRNFFQMIPDSLEESAHIDGANDFTVFVWIILPLSTASIASIGLFYAVAHWNAWFDAMIYLNSSRKLPIQNLLRRVLTSLTSLGSDGIQMGEDTTTSSRTPTADVLQYACITVTVLPILAVYPFLQKYFVKGVMAGSLKG